MAARTSPEWIRFTPERVQAILKDIEDEIPYRQAALSNGVSEQGFYKWIEKGEAELHAGIQTEHTQLVEAINTIEKKRIKDHMDRIKFSPKGHDGSKWILERRYWKQFSSYLINKEINERLDKLERERSNE